MAVQEPVTDRTERQQAAVAAWERQAELLSELAGGASTSREARMDAQRQLEALRRTQDALLARTGPDAGTAPRGEGPQAVLVHRSAWLRDKLGQHLAELGIRVLAEAEDGAEGLGIAIAEQPDVLVIEDRLPSLPAVELVAGVREYALGALVAVHVEHQEDVPRLVAAGVDAVFSRRVAPSVMAEELAALLTAPRDEPLLVG
jgi:hypothetical protein